MNKKLINEWYSKFAPGLNPQTIPDEAVIERPFTPLVPFGIQYRIKMPDGSVFPRHQSGPGATVAITDGERLVVKKEFRPESNTAILKCAGGFAGTNSLVASDMVKIFDALLYKNPVIVKNNEYENLRSFLDKLCRREYQNWRLGDKDINFCVRPIGNPNVKICSILGFIIINSSELNQCIWPKIITFKEARQLVKTFQFGDQNTDLLIRELLHIYS
ncbi:MAG: hypothetical protein Q8Q23_04855 [bacterium]|nr:hypothetical protein [bacterium]